MVGMKTCYDILSYWGAENSDEQMLTNAEYIKQHFIDQGHMGLLSGQGYYSYPDPTYQNADFLDVPDISRAEEFASLVGV
jgi:3-hydroxybutyryl-CoA dehydrogenase